MSRPATSCSRRYADSVSTYCSRKREITIASRNERVPRFSVYQLGRGNDPVTVVGSIFPAVAFNICAVVLDASASIVQGQEWYPNPYRAQKFVQRKRHTRPHCGIAG